MKLIKINESQQKRLFEAYQEGFSFDHLSILGNDAFSDEESSSKLQFEYCRKWLGEPVAQGSSRCIFMLSDNLVLKLAHGRYEAGKAQNRLECQLYEETKSPLLVRIFGNDDNYTYIICENVVSAQPIDFEKIIDIPFYNRYYDQRNSEYSQYFENPRGNYEKVPYDVYDIVCYLEANYTIGEGYYNREVENSIMHSPWLKQLKKLIMDTQIGDLTTPENYGVVNRDGNPMLVVLDAGMNLENWETYYHG
jgi:hypothetical protein